MPSELICKNARQLFAELAFNIYHYDIRTSLQRIARVPHERIKDSLDDIYASINWTNRASVLKIVPIFEEIYRNAPRDSLERHRKIDSLLYDQGFRFAAGKLVRIRQTMNECR